MRAALLALLLTATPDPALTPGKVDPAVSKEVICTTSTRDRRKVTDRMKTEVFRRYGIRRDGKTHEVDHLVPLCAGGANDLTNLWPEPWPDAHAKDRLEVRLCRAVCLGELELAAAQAQLQAWHAEERADAGVEVVTPGPP